MGHCAGGLGPNRFGNSAANAASGQLDPEHDVFSALTRWVEQGVAPEKLIGSGNATGEGAKSLTRPLCMYPRVAHYGGSGDPYDAGNFSCAIPAR
jgi:feruloyl esterase